MSSLCGVLCWHNFVAQGVQIWEMLQVEYDDVVPVLPAKSMTHNKSFLDRLQRV